MVGVIGVNIDATEQQESEEALRPSEARFSNAFEYAAIGMALVSLDGRWLKVNQALSDSMGYCAEEFSGITFQEITHPDDQEAGLANLRQLLAGEIRSYKQEKRYFHRDGRVVWILLGVSLLRDKQNRPLYYISQFEDISEIKQAMTRQRELAEEAQAAERAKSDFLAVMSHEIRTPMNGVIGMTGLLLDTGLNAEQRGLAETIRTSGEALLGLLNDILDFSKIDAGHLSFEEIDFDLRKVVEDTLEMMAGQAQANGIELVGGVEPEVPTKVRGDPGRVQQVLTNLIGNAIKFTKSGEVVINVTVQAETKTELHARFEIKDTGIGIPLETQARLFQPFGYNADVVANGIEVLIALETKRYDIILMDCQMPDLDGYENTREIRRREQGGQRSWVIAMTANVMAGDREKCLAAGMDDYVSKPLRRAELRAALERTGPSRLGVHAETELQ